MKYEKTLKKLCRQPKLTPDQIRDIFRKSEGVEVYAEPKDIGKPGFEIKTDEGLCFVTERNIDYYNKKFGRVTTLQEISLNLAIPFPLYIGQGTISEAINRIYKSSDPNREADNWLHEVFTIEIVAAYFLKYFSVSDSFKEYKAIIFEAIEAYYIGMDNIAIMSLIPVFEAGLRNIQNNILKSGFDNVSSKKFESGLKDIIIQWGRRRLENYIWHPGKYCDSDVEIDFLTHICPQCDVVNAFRLFFKGILYKPSSENTGGLNRHVIVHLLKNDFSNPANFARIFLALTHITFIESLQNSQIPFFWPGLDDKDKALGTYIRSISKLIGDPRRKLLKKMDFIQYDDGKNGQYE